MKALLTKFLKKEKPVSSQEKVSKTEKETERWQENALGQGLNFDPEEDDEIVNTLVNMADHLKITKINRELQGEYITLSHVNHVLCQQIIPLNQIRLFLRSKSGEAVDMQKEGFANKSSRTVQSSTSKGVTQYYTQFSNGLIFQFYSIRALIWKVSLGYLPVCKNKWISRMQGGLLQYQQFIREHIVQIVLRKKRRKENALEESAEKEKKMTSDHPLNVLKESKWKTFFEDKELWNVIEKDTVRTRGACKFFREQFQIEFCENELEEKGVCKTELHLSKSKDKNKTYYYDCLTRIIYIYLKRHPQLTYCQGLNELAALVFYSFANKNSQYFRRVAESDAYFCFQIVTEQLLKHSPSGFLNGEKYAHRFQELLQKIDLRLFQTLSAKPENMQGIKMLSIKWFNSLFLAEFSIDECLVLWDGFISVIAQGQSAETSTSFANMLMSIALAIVHLNRNGLSEGQNPLLLFSKITNSPEAILEKAMSLLKIFHQFFP